MAKKYHIILIFFILIGTTGHVYASNTERNPQATLELIEAIQNEDVNGVKEALEAGANPNCVSNTKVQFSAIGHTLFCFYRPPIFPEHKKIEKQCVEILRMLFNFGAKIQQCDHRMLHWPISANFPEVVNLLLNKGIDLNYKSDDGLSWVEVAEQEGHKEIVDMLVKRGGKPVSNKEALQLRFINFVREGNFIEMEKTIREGAYIKGVDKQGNTALNTAFFATDFDCERYAIVLYLLNKGVNPNRLGKAKFKGMPGIPLHNAIATTAITFRLGRKEKFERKPKPKSFHDREVYARLALEALLEAGAFVSARGEDGQTPLHIAAKCGNLIGAQMLIEAGAKIMPKDDTGNTPLDYAESAEMIKLLKSHGAKEQ